MRDNLTGLCNRRYLYNSLNGLIETSRARQASLSVIFYAVAYAGDEFVIVLPGFNSFQAVEKASNLQSRIKSAVYLHDYGHEVKLQASYGIAAFPDYATDLTGLLASADRALFCVQEKGKGGVGLADRLTSFKDMFNHDGFATGNENGFGRPLS